MAEFDATGVNEEEEEEEGGDEGGGAPSSQMSQKDEWTSFILLVEGR